ncbi:MAG: YceD family protein [Salinisphaera sp.]|jgi:uncharacterized protein|nr:YceD family protein [Salinisphaera sp.]
MKQLVTLARILDYRRLALTGQTLTGQLTLKQLPRTRGALAADEAPVIEVSLDFAEDAQRRVRLKGRAAGQLVMTCQRCLQSFETTVAADIAGVVVSDDDAAASVPREDEPILAGDGVIDIHELVDDELLLALPLVARCHRPECRAEYEIEAPAEQISAGERKTNPFAVLQSLKSDEPPQR